MAKRTGVWPVERARKDGSVTHYARWICPETGKRKDTNLDKLKLTTRRDRERWIKDKAQAIADRRREIAKGAPIKGNTSPDEAVDMFLSRQANKSDSTETLKAYRKASKKFLAWADSSGLRTVEDLNLPRLSKFYTWITAQPKKKAKRKGRAGEKAKTKEKRAASGINSDLTGIRAMLSDFRRMGLTPSLSRDDVRDALPKLPVDRSKDPILDRDEIRRLLEACIAHDSDTFALTRDGKTTKPKYDHPIGPLVVCALLSGCRIGELLTLTWGNVSLDRSDPQLSVIGKTRRERAVSLSESPALVDLLRAIKPNRIPDKSLVFGFSEQVATDGRLRLGEKYGAPPFLWSKTQNGLPTLRATCGTYLTCSPSIYGAASVYMSAKRLGHSVAVAERHYLGRVDVDPEAKSLAAAMGISDLVADVARAAVG